MINYFPAFTESSDSPGFLAFFVFILSYTMSATKHPATVIIKGTPKLQNFSFISETFVVTKLNHLEVIDTIDTQIYL